MVPCNALGKLVGELVEENREGEQADGDHAYGGHQYDCLTLMKALHDSCKGVGNPCGDPGKGGRAGDYRQ